jgi:hypothetical protein
MYIGKVQRAVGGRVVFLIIRESFLLKVLAMAQLYIARQCVSPKENNNKDLLIQKSKNNTHI